MKTYYKMLLESPCTVCEFQNVLEFYFVHKVLKVFWKMTGRLEFIYGSKLFLMCCAQLSSTCLVVLLCID